MEHDHRQNIDLIRIILINLIDKETVRVMDAHYVALQPLVGHECTCIEYGFTIIAQQITNHILFKQFKFSFFAHTPSHIRCVCVLFASPCNAQNAVQNSNKRRRLADRQRQTWPWLPHIRRCTPHIQQTSLVATQAMSSNTHNTRVHSIF
eukprot:478588_1